jgi:hypothetical protein
MRILSLLAVLFVGLLALAPASHAATINLAVTFNASNFTGNEPVNPVTGSFDVTFDPTHVYIGDKNVITNLVMNINFSDTVNFSYIPFVGGSIGGTHLGSLGLQKNTDDFRLLFTLIGIDAFTYTQAGNTGIYTAFTPNVTFTVTATPLPASLVMLLTALGALGGVGYMRGRKMEPQVAMFAAA